MTLTRTRTSAAFAVLAVGVVVAWAMLGDKPETPRRVLRSHDLSSQVGPKAAPFIRKLAAGESVVIVTMGTSLTYGRNKWVPQLERWLKESFPGKATVINEAVPLSASEHRIPAQSGLRAVDRVLSHDPDVVFIEFAFNDAYRPFKISPEESKANLNHIIDRILEHDPDAEIILQTMNCAFDAPGMEFEKPAKKRRFLATYYEGYREVARDRGLLLIDHYPNWLALLESDPERFVQLVPDGIHPRTVGSREVILPEMKRSLLGEGEATRSLATPDESTSPP